MYLHKIGISYENQFKKTEFSIFTLLLLLLSVFPVSADLIDEGKSDSTIKMLVFPKSLRVIENRDNELNDIFTNPKRIRKNII